MNPIVRFVWIVVCGMGAGLALVIVGITVCASTVTLRGTQKTEALGYSVLALLGGPALGCLVGLIAAVWDLVRKR